MRSASLRAAVVAVLSTAALATPALAAPHQQVGSRVAPDPAAAPSGSTGACGGRSQAVNCGTPAPAAVSVPAAAQHALATELAAGARPVAVVPATAPESARRALAAELAAVPAVVSPGSQRAAARSRLHSAVSPGPTDRAAPHGATAALAGDVSQR